jgi:hypothetical protein
MWFPWLQGNRCLPLPQRVVPHLPGGQTLCLIFANWQLVWIPGTFPQPLVPFVAHFHILIKIRTQYATIGCGNPLSHCHCLNTDLFYVCPKDQSDEIKQYNCGGTQHFFCYYWNCVTMCDASWNPSSSWDLITVKRNNSNTHGCFRGVSQLNCSPCGKFGACNPFFTNSG